MKKKIYLDKTIIDSPILVFLCILCSVFIVYFYMTYIKVNSYVTQVGVVKCNQNKECYFVTMSADLLTEKETRVLWYQNIDNTYRYEAKVHRTLENNKAYMVLNAKDIEQKDIREGDSIYLEFAGPKVSIGKRILKIMSDM